jgi:hypothetical protein
VNLFGFGCERQLDRGRNVFSQESATLYFLANLLD